MKMKWQFIAAALLLSVAFATAQNGKLFFLVACTRLFKSLCRSVRSLVRYTLFFLKFSILKVKQFVWTNKLTGRVTCRVACMRLTAIGLVQFQYSGNISDPTDKNF